MKTPISVLGLFVSAFLLLTISLTTGCGGDDDDGEAFSPPATVPDQLNYEISQRTGSQLTVTLNPSATVTSTLLTGTFNRLTLAFTLNVQPAAMTVSAGEFLSLFDIALGDTGFSEYSLHITEAAAWVGDADPTIGEFEVFDDAVRKITMAVIADVNNTGLPGVQITYWPDGEANPGSSDSVSYTWQALDGFIDDPAPEPYANIAAFAYGLLRLMYEQGGLVIQALELIAENDVVLEEFGPVEESCDTFPLDRPPNTQEVMNPGTSTIFWSDANFDNSIGPGDSFFLDLVDCWDDDETDLFDVLYNGSVEFVNYTEVQTDGVITRVGFEPSGGPGGISFTGLAITETEDDGANILIGPDMITLTGGFSMVFTSP